MKALDAVSLYVSRQQDEFHYVADNLLLYSRLLVAADKSDSGLTCSVGGGHLANERRTASNNTTGKVTCETRRPCDVNQLDEVSEIYACILDITVTVAVQTIVSLLHYMCMQNLLKC